MKGYRRPHEDVTGVLLELMGAVCGRKNHAEPINIAPGVLVQIRRRARQQQEHRDGPNACVHKHPIAGEPLVGRVRQPAFFVRA